MNLIIFKECLGMSDDEIGDLIAEGVITNEGQYFEKKLDNSVLK
jgi:hypothetical protein